MIPICVMMEDFPVVELELLNGGQLNSFEENHAFINIVIQVVYQV